MQAYNSMPSQDFSYWTLLSTCMTQFVGSSLSSLNDEGESTISQNDEGEPTLFQKGKIWYEKWALFLFPIPIQKQLILCREVTYWQDVKYCLWTLLYIPWKMRVTITMREILPINYWKSFWGSSHPSHGILTSWKRSLMHWILEMRTITQLHQTRDSQDIWEQ